MSEYLEDDLTILGDDVLLRRVKLKMITYDPKSQKLRPYSSNFKDSESDNALEAHIAVELEKVNKDYKVIDRKTPMSIYLQSVLTVNQLSPQAILDGHSGFALVGINIDVVRQAAQARSCPQRFVRQPRPIPPQYELAHGWLADKKTGGFREYLSGACFWIIRPSDAWIESNRIALNIPNELDAIHLCGNTAIPLAN